MQQPDSALFTLLSSWFSALAEPARLRLVWELKQGEANVTKLVEATGLSQASVSKHLAILRMAGMVEARRVAQQAIYRLSEPALLQICDIVCGTVARRQNELAAALSRGLGENTELNLKESGMEA